MNFYEANERFNPQNHKKMYLSLVLLRKPKPPVLELNYVDPTKNVNLTLPLDTTKPFVPFRKRATFEDNLIALIISLTIFVIVILSIACIRVYQNFQANRAEKLY
ncbi:hypothetical protein CTI12_AA553470 [Artemisia annua]|uniref:Uncharacterized protein n=1 Tax=Artemisia annua TaxID=35608 RepID=A0A2U1KXK1_ARTAN|nr:hypothetical protein CTI12_AA553470 [Artemisia annua]